MRQRCMSRRRDGEPPQGAGTEERVGAANEPATVEKRVGAANEPATVEKRAGAANERAAAVEKGPVTAGVTGAAPGRTASRPSRERPVDPGAAPGPARRRR